MLMTSQVAGLVSCKLGSRVSDQFSESQFDWATFPFTQMVWYSTASNKTFFSGHPLFQGVSYVLPHCPILLFTMIPRLYIKCIYLEWRYIEVHVRRKYAYIENTRTSTKVHFLQLYRHACTSIWL